MCILCLYGGASAHRRKLIARIEKSGCEPLFLLAGYLLLPFANRYDTPAVGNQRVNDFLCLRDIDNLLPFARWGLHNGRWLSQVVQFKSV